MYLRTVLVFMTLICVNRAKIVEIERFHSRNIDDRTLQKLFIFPGTKWCGAGNIAINDNDLGVFKQEDQCCRSHDKCSDIIKGFQNKHDLKNNNFFTRLNCQCDEDFYKCLKTANTDVSTIIGSLYFNILGTYCFKNEYPIKECRKYSEWLYLLRDKKEKCLEYTLDTTKPKQYQWFDVPQY